MWTALFTHAKFIRPIRENLQTLIAANEAAALAWANDGAAMDPFKVYRKALWYNTLWPVISIVSQTTEMVGAGDEALPQKHSILVEIEDSGPDPDELTVSVERRVAAIDMIITSANPNLLKTGMDADHIAIHEVSVASHDYSQFTRGQNRYLQVGSLMVKVVTIEA